MICRDGQVRYLDKFSKRQRAALQALVWAVFEVVHAGNGEKVDAKRKLAKALKAVEDMPL